MPKLSKRYEYSEEFLSISKESSLYREKSDCAVKAVAVACDVSYGKAHRVLKELGRKNRQGTYFHMTKAACEKLGFKLISRDPREFIFKYPKAHHVLKSVTTNHPDRFPNTWRDGKTYLFRVNGHILAVKNGVNCDWSRGRAKRCRNIYEVVPNSKVKVSEVICSLQNVIEKAENHPRVKLFSAAIKFNVLKGSDAYNFKSTEYLLNEISSQLYLSEELYGLCEKCMILAREFEKTNAEIY